MMKGHQKRFQEALKRLDREIHSKASQGMYSRSYLNSQQQQQSLQTLQKVKTQTNFTDIHPPSSPTCKKSRTGRFKPLSEQRSFNNSDVPKNLVPQQPPVESFISTNPRNLQQMLRIPKDAAFSAHPKEIGPSLHWNDRNFLDYSKIETVLSEKTQRLHKLVTKKFETKTDDSHTLPIDFFDCFNDAPAEEIFLRNNCNNNVEIRGYTKMRYQMQGEDDMIEWSPCTILQFNPQSSTFTVAIDNKLSAFDSSKQMIKEVSRFNLHFEGENLSNLNNRYTLADNLRAEYEQNLRTITFLDTVDSAPNVIMRFLSDNLKKNLPEDAFIELLRTQKMQIIRDSLKLDSDPQLESLINKLNININAYSPIQMKEPFKIPTDFFKSLNRIVNNSAMISITGFMKLRRGFHITCQTYIMKIISFYKEFFNEKQVTVYEWEIKKNDLYDHVRDFLFEFVDTIVQLIMKHIGYILDEVDADIENNREADKKLSKHKSNPNERPYLQFFYTENTLFNRLRKVLLVVLRQFAFDLLDENLVFFINLINYEYPPINFEKVDCKGFSTISSQLSEDSITCKKPLIVVDLKTGNKESAKKVIFDLYNICADVLKRLVNPIMVLFEKSDAKSVSEIQHSKFEPFLLTYDFSNFQPELLHYTNNDFDDYRRQLSSVFEVSLDKHIECSFSIFPTIKNHSNEVMLFFTKENFPKIEEVYNVLTLLDEQRMFFLKHFPPTINKGIFLISFLAFKKDIDESIQSYRNNSLQNITTELVSKMNNLHKNYTDLSEKLKSGVQSVEQWKTLQDTMDNVLKIREDLESEAEKIDVLYNLLFSLFYGLEANILVRYLNTMMWPILIDMELGQSIALMITMRNYFLNQNPTTINQLNSEVNKLEESIKTEKNFDARMKLQNYKTHLLSKITRIEEISFKMKSTNYDMFTKPRVRLYCLVTLCQNSIMDWQEVKINELDLYKIKNTIDDYLKQLRLLTRSFRGDANSLRLLISTKNDLEQLYPLFKTCAQVLSDKLKESHRKEIEKLIGFTNFPEMTLSQLKAEANICEKAPEIHSIYQRSKSEDKTDIELINCEKIVNSLQLYFNKRKITNIDTLVSILREQKTVLANIQSLDNIPQQKILASHKLVASIRQMIEVLDLLGTIQDLMSLLAPLRKVSSLKEQANEIAEINKNFNENIKFLQQNLVLISYATRHYNVVNLKNIKSRLSVAHQRLIVLVAQMRNKNARLILVPDSLIISIFADDLTLKSKILSIAFPGITSWVFSTTSNELTAVNLETEDTLVLTEPLTMTETIMTLIPKIEKELTSSMKMAFFGNEKFENLPLQLCFLRLLAKPNLEYNSSLMTQQKIKTLEIFRQSIKDSTNKIEVIVDNSNKTVFLSANDGKVEYGFQISRCCSYLYSPHLFSLLFEIISLHNNNCNRNNKSGTILNEKSPFLIYSNTYSISTISIEYFSFITGRPCFVIHPTVTTPINRLPKIIQLLSNLDINVIVDEVEVFSLKQMFELVMLIQNKLQFYCSLTANSVPSVIEIGKKSYLIKTADIQSHLEFIASKLFPDSKKQTDFVTQTLTKYLHIETAKKYLETSFQKGNEAFDLNFVPNIQLVIPPEVFESALPDILESVSVNTKKKLQVGTVILSTQDFVHGVELISKQFKLGTQIMMVAGPPFSGITTCIQAAAQSMNIPLISLAFSSNNWIRYIVEALASNDEKPLVLHILLPFDHIFSAHASSLLMNGLICEGKDSLLQISSKIFIVFEMMTPVTTALQVPIPIFTFSTPLVKSSELLLYWIVNSKIEMNYEDREYIRSLVSQIINDSSHQLSIFYTLFSSLLTVFPTFSRDSLSIMLGYCIFWSKTNEFTSSEEWISYSQTIKSSIKQFSEYPLELHEYIIEEPGNYLLNNKNNLSNNDASNNKDNNKDDERADIDQYLFSLRNVYKNPKCITFDDSHITQYNEFQCGLMSLTNIPTPQFMHCYQQMPILIQEGKSILLIGKKGTGKTTIAKAITSKFFQEPDYISLSFDGRTLTEEELLNQIMSISVITVEGIIQPKDNCTCIITIDPFPVEVSQHLYGSILSISKTQNAVINQKIVSFKKFQFILCVEEYNYQLSTCCYPIALQPYSDNDFIFMAKETVSRILLKRFFTASQISQIMTSLSSFVPQLVKVINSNYCNEKRFLHFFFKVLRSVDNVSAGIPQIQQQATDVVEFFKWKITKLLPHSIRSKLPFTVSQDFELISTATKSSNYNNNKSETNEDKNEAGNNNANSNSKANSNINNKAMTNNNNSNNNSKESNNNNKTISSINNGCENKMYVYASTKKGGDDNSNSKTSQFEEAMTPFVHLFLYSVKINASSLGYLSFALDVVMSANGHAMVVNDLNQDYEMLTQFAASTISAQFTVFHSIQQLVGIVRDAVSSPQPIIIYCRKPEKSLLSLISRGLKTTELKDIALCLTDSVMIEKMDHVRSNVCNFPYSNLGLPYLSSGGNVKGGANIMNSMSMISTTNFGLVSSTLINTGSTVSSVDIRKSRQVIENDQTFSPELSQSQTVAHRMRSSDFAFLQMHLFRTVHIFFSVTTEDEIDSDDRSLLNHWDQSNTLPETDNPLIQHLFEVMMRFKDKSFVKMVHQLPKVIKRYDYIIDRVNKYLDQRHLFVQQIIVVIKAIETSISDTSDLISSTKKQIEMDEAFLQTHTQAVEYRQTIVTDLTGELARNRVELDQINSKDEEYNAYKQKDAANTGAAVDVATKLVVKSFTQEEQYKLYIQQNPSAAVRHLFNTYCILREFTPREDNDYWPEARVLLKSGRFHRTITVFDKNNIKKNVILQFDVMMNSPLMKEENFPANSACRSLAQWIKAVHKHTQSTSFNTTVSQEMLELVKSKARKEKEIEDIEKRLKTARDDLSKHEKSLKELKDKIKHETILLSNVVCYNDAASSVSKCFEIVKNELNMFTEGETKNGQNLKGFALLEVAKLVVYPLFSLEQRQLVEKQVEELMGDIGFDPTYFVSLKEIIGNDDPLVMAILSGDRLIAAYDPNDTEFDLLSSDPVIPALASSFEFIITDPLDNDFQQNVINCSENGKILVIHHSNLVLNDPFLNSIASPTVTSSTYNNKLINIKSEFRVIFLLDVPPQSLNPHITFIYCPTLVLAKLESILMNDSLPLQSEQKKTNAEMMLQAQRENLYVSLQQLNSQLQKIHASDMDVLKDVLLQAQLLQTSIQARNNSIVMQEHVLDGFEWIRPVTDQIVVFINKLQSLYKISPLYLWSFSKVRKIIDFLKDNKKDMMTYLYQNIASSILKSHLWKLEELKSVNKEEILKNINKLAENERLIILHYTDIALAAEFFLKDSELEDNMPKTTEKQIENHENQNEQKNDVFLENTFNYSIESDTLLDINEIKKLLLDTEKRKDIVITFFGENEKVANDIARVVVEFPPEKWHKKTRIFILTNNELEMPTHLILNFQLFALE